MSGDEELLDTIEQIRQAKFPEVPAELVKEIALIEANFTENRQEAYRRIGQAVDVHVQKLAAKDAGDH